jgi:hypothetical protein
VFAARREFGPPPRVVAALAHVERVRAQRRVLALRRVLHLPLGVRLSDFLFLLR